MKPLLVTIFCGVAVERLRRAFPQCDVLAFPGTRADRAAVERSIKGRPLWVPIGYSAGCHGVRELLDLEPPAVVAVDGVHSSLRGRPQTMPAEPWRRLFERAQAGSALWLTSHTYNVYTEALRDGPYRSTVGTLRDVTSALLPMPEPGHSPLVLRMPSLASADGAVLAGTVVASYRSEPCDKGAHGRQIYDKHDRSALEYLTGEFLAPLLGAASPPGPGWARQAIDAVAGALRAIAAVPRMSTLSYSEAVLAAARLSYAEGVREGHVKNTGAVIDRWLAEVGAGAPNNWCAAAATHWLREAAARSGLPAPVPGSAGAKEIMRQFQRAGRWLDVAVVRRDPSLLRPGMIVVWHRGAPGAWTGHVGVTETANDRVDVDATGARLEVTFGTIEGNSGPNADAVARMVRRLDDPLLLGFGVT